MLEEVVKKGTLYKSNGSGVSMANKQMDSKVVVKTNNLTTIITLRFKKKGLKMNLVGTNSKVQVRDANQYDEYIFEYQGPLKNEYKLSANFMGTSQKEVILKLS